MIHVPMPAFIVRWLLAAVALALTAWIIPGINVDDRDGVLAVLVMAAVLGLVNAIIRPILTLLSCGLVVATMGLFLLVINTVTFWLSAWIAESWFDAGYTIDGFFPAFFGGIIVGLFSFFLNLLVTSSDEERPD
jgi:putative membrane protein